MNIRECLKGKILIEKNMKNCRELFISCLCILYQIKIENDAYIKHLKYAIYIDHILKDILFYFLYFIKEKIRIHIIQVRDKYNIELLKDDK